MSSKRASCLIVSVDTRDEARVRPLLEALFPERLVTVEELDIEALNPILEASHQTVPVNLIVGGDRRWLSTLIALILETRRGGSGQLAIRN